MKIPAVAIAAAFAGGIVLGRLPGIVPYGARPSFLAAILALAGAVLCVAVVFAWRNLFWLAASAFLLCWLGLGVAAEWLARRPLPPEHILWRLAAHQVPLRTPLPWNGTLSTPCLPKMTPGSSCRRAEGRPPRSRTLTNPQFLDAVNPRISVISAGEENPYGQPHPELLEGLEETRILRTDRDGAVQILTHGHELQVSCFRACPLAATESVSAQVPDHHHGNQQ